MFIIDRIAYTNNLTERHPAGKALISLPALVTILLADSIYIGLSVFIIISVLIIGWAKIKPCTYIKLLSLPFAFIVVSTLSIVIILHKGSFNPANRLINIGPYYLGVTDESLTKGLLIFVKTFSCITCFYFFTPTTPMTDILYLLKRMHVPEVLRELILLIYRYIFIFNTYAKTIHTAQKVRLGYGKFAGSLRSLSMLVSTIFIKSYTFSGKYFQALRARGYEGSFRVIHNVTPIRLPFLTGVGVLHLLIFALVIGLPL